MKKITRNLLFVYLGLVLIKIVLFSFIKTPSAFADYYIYAKMAQSFFHLGVFQIHGVDTFLRPPLYPMLLSISYIFKDMTNVFLSMKVINALISTSIIFPSYLLAKEFLTRKRSFLVALLIGLIPSTFAFSVYLMSENLFYPLFMFSIFFLYKSFTENSYKWDVLLGLFVGLSFLTRTIGIVLIVITILSFILYSFKYRKEFSFQLKKKLVVAGLFILTILPLILRNFLNFGVSLSSLLGIDASEATAIATGTYSISSFLTLFAFYLAFVVLSSGIVFFIANFSVFKMWLKDKEHYCLVIISVVALISSLFIAANHNPGTTKYILLYSWFTGKLVGRYIDYILPLVFILGFIGFQHVKNDKKLLKFIFPVVGLLLVFSTQIVFSSLYPINNLSLSWIGTINFLINYVVFNTTEITYVYSMFNTLFFGGFFILLTVFGYFLFKIKLKKILPFVFIFFFAVSLLSVGITKFDSDNWNNIEQIKLGQWFNEYDKDKISNVVFDERDRGRLNKNVQLGIYEGKGGGYSIVGFWMHDNIKIGSVDNLEDVDYFITKNELPYELIYSSEDDVRVYKI